VGDHVWLHLSKERSQGLVKKLKPIRYLKFEIMDQVGENDFKFNLLTYIYIYSIMNMGHLKLYEPSMLTKDEVGSNHILPSLNDLDSNTMDELKEDSILQKKVCATRRHETKLRLAGLKR